MNIRKTGLIMIVGALLLWVAERNAKIPSQLIGRLHCGDRYLRELEGVTGALPCGTHDVMYLNSLLLAMLLLGFVLSIRGKRQHS